MREDDVGLVLVQQDFRELLIPPPRDLTRRPEAELLHVPTAIAQAFQQDPENLGRPRAVQSVLHPAIFRVRAGAWWRSAGQRQGEYFVPLVRESGQRTACAGLGVIAVTSDRDHP